jgi:hypothetical protein
LAKQICSGYFLPEASRFDQLEETEWAFGSMGMQDKAKHLATLYLEDLSDCLAAGPTDWACAMLLGQVTAKDTIIAVVNSKGLKRVLDKK